MKDVASKLGRIAQVELRAVLANGIAAIAGSGIVSLSSRSGRAEGSKEPTSTRPTHITFDTYGTMTQWNQSLAAVLRDILRTRGRPDADVKLATDVCNAATYQLKAISAFRSYRLILREALKPALATAGLAPTASDGDLLIERLSRVPPFPEVPGVLAELAKTFKLAPITNSDDDFVAGTLNGLGPVFTTAITAEQAQAYKPNPHLFLFALHKLGIDRSQLLHVGVGQFPDVAICNALGIRVVWVNRTDQSLQKGLEPIATIPDLSKIPEIARAL